MNENPTPQRHLGLGLALRHAHLRAARFFAEELRPLELENHHAGILLHVGLLGCQTQRQLVDGMGADKSAVVRALDHLERRDLVRREANPTDRRAHTVVLTDAGLVMLGRVREAVGRAETRMTAGFSPEDAELLRSLVARFADAPSEEQPSEEQPSEGPPSEGQPRAT